MKCLKKTGIFLAAIICAASFFSCKKQEEQTDTIEITENETGKSKSHKWFYFNREGYAEVKLPQLSPKQPELPWTEALRISGMNCDGVSTATAPDNRQKAYATVNRLGMLVFDGDTVDFVKDVNLFPGRTAGNIVFVNGEPVFSLYKSSFFNDKSNDGQHPFLVHFDVKSKIAYPLINTENLLEDGENCEVTDYVWDGRTWVCSVKNETGGKNEFTYIKWTSELPLLSLSPVNASQNITKSECSVDQFRALKEPLTFNQSPERLKKLLNGLPSTVKSRIEISTAGGTSARIYTNAALESDTELNAYGILNDTWSAVLFQDGTLYLEGALDGRRILRNGKTIAIRLPKLPYTYVYTGFCISGTTLYASWEESDFYKTGRAGFLQVDLDKTLYQNDKVKL